jgi:hypothetical protein
MDKKGMKSGVIMAITVFIAIFLVGEAIVCCGYVRATKTVADNMSDNIFQASTELKNQINNNLIQKKSETESLAKTDAARSMLKQPLVSCEAGAKEEVDYRSQIVAKQALNYLRANPDLSLDDLLSREEFKDIVIRDIGKEDSSFLIDADSLTIKLHQNSRYLNFDIYSALRSFDPAGAELLSGIKAGEAQVSGDLDWPESGSGSRKMYAKVVRLPLSTADGVFLAIGTTAYIDDYQAAKYVDPAYDSFLKNAEKSEFNDDIMLISVDGYVVYETNQLEVVGSNAGWPSKARKGLSGAFYQAKNAGQTVFGGPFQNDDSSSYFLVISPVVDDKGGLLGYVGVLSDMDYFFDLIKREGSKFQNEIRISLVDSQLSLITPFTSSSDMFIQKIDYPQIKECFSRQMTDSLPQSYLDYRGEEMFGSGLFISQAGWCLIVEEDAYRAKVPASGYFGGKLCVVAIVSLILGIIGFGIGLRHYSKNKHLFF